MFTMAPDEYNNDTTDFLEDLSNLNNDLKHPDKQTEIEDINIDALLETEQPQTQEIVKVENTSSVPAVTETDDQNQQQPVIQQQEDRSPEEIQDYILSQCKDVIMQGKSTLEQLQDTVVNTCDGKAINGYATLLASLGKVMDTANAIANERSRIKSAIEMENLKHKHKTQIKSSEPSSVTNNALIVAGREEIMKMLNQRSV